MKGEELAGGDTEVLARLRPVETPVGSRADSREDVTPARYEEAEPCKAGDWPCDWGGDGDKTWFVVESSTFMEFSSEETTENWSGWGANSPTNAAGAECIDGIVSSRASMEEMKAEVVRSGIEGCRGGMIEFTESGLSMYNWEDGSCGWRVDSG